jgi:hypothetical protein
MIQCAEGEKIDYPINRKIGLKGRLLFGDVGWLINILKGINVDGDKFHIPSKTQAIKEFIKEFHPSVKYDILTLKDPMPGIINIAKYLKLVRSGVRESFQIRVKNNS